MIEKILLYALGRTYDITELIDPVSVSFLEHRDAETFDTGTLEIQLVRKNHFENLDMSRPIPTYSLIEIYLEDEIIQGYVVEDITEPIIINKDIYKHTVRIVEPLQITTKIPLPSLAITQAKSPGFVFGRAPKEGTTMTALEEKVFSGASSGALYFQNPDKPIPMDNGTNYLNYNFFSEDNEFIGRSSKGMLIGSVVTREVPMKEQIYFDGKEAHQIKLDFSVLNPHFNTSIKRRKHGTGKVYTDVEALFKNGESEIVLEVSIGSHLLLKENIEIVPSTLKNGIWTSTKDKFVGGASWTSIPGENPYLLPTEETHYNSVSYGNNIRIRNSKKGATPPSSSNPVDIVDNFSVVLGTEDRNYFTRVLDVPEGLDGELIIKIGLAKREYWKISGRHEHKNIFGRVYKTDFPAREILKKVLISNFSVLTFDDSRDAQYIDTTLEKFFNQVKDHRITLDPNSKARLAEFKMPELTYDQNNLYEVLKDIAAYTGSVPRIEIDGAGKKTIWESSNLSAFNQSGKKLHLTNIPQDHYLDFLNTEYRNIEAGTYARIDEGYSFIHINQEEFDASDVKLTVQISQGISIWSALRIQHPDHFEHRDQLIDREVAIAVVEGWSVSYVKLQRSTNYFYAKVVETDKRDHIKTVYFDFYDDFEKEEIMPVDNVYSSALYRDGGDYSSSFDLNIENLVAEDEVVDTGWLKLGLLDGTNTEIESDNLGLTLPLGPIYQIVEVYGIAGRELEFEGGTFTDADEIFNLTGQVVEEAYYSTFINKADYTAKERQELLTKNQVLYYKQGDDKIYNMGYTGIQSPHLLGLEQYTIRAIWEMFYKAATIAKGANIKEKDTTKLEDDLGIRLRFKYIPYKKIRTNIYKDDQSGFTERLSRFYNAQQKVNNPAVLGRVAQEEINRTGNTKLEKVGAFNRADGIPKLNTLDEKGGRVLSVRNRVFLPKLTSFAGTYIKDYGVKNEHFGIDSAYRQWEVPMDDIVLRVDRRTVPIYIGGQPTIEDAGLMTMFTGIFDKNERVDMKPTHVIVETRDHYGTEIAKVIRPAQTIALGKGLSHYYEMKDNYSADSRIVKELISVGDKEERQFLEIDTKYGDSFGNVDIAILSFVRINPEDTLALIENNVDYPILDTLAGINYETITTHTYRVEKDAREIMAFSQDIKFFSGDVELFNVYEGMAKFNSWGSFPTAEIEVRALRSKISKSAKRVNKENINFDSNVNFIRTGGQIAYTITGSDDTVGIVFYEKNSLEPLLTIYTDKFYGYFRIGDKI